jgi:hypothetical protein
VNKGELQYYDYSIAVSSTLLLVLTHVPNLVAAHVWFVWRMYEVPYSDINTPSPADSGRRAGGERGQQRAETGVEVVAASEAKQGQWR